MARPAPVGPFRRERLYDLFKGTLSQRVEQVIEDLDALFTVTRATNRAFINLLREVKH